MSLAAGWIIVAAAIMLVAFLFMAAAVLLLLMKHPSAAGMTLVVGLLVSVSALALLRFALPF